MFNAIKEFFVEVVAPLVIGLAAVFLILIVGGATIRAVAISLGYEPPDPHADYMEVCLAANIHEEDCELRYHEMRMVQDAIQRNNRRLDDDDAAAIMGAMM